MPSNTIMPQNLLNQLPVFVENPTQGKDQAGKPCDHGVEHRGQQGRAHNINEQAVAFGVVFVEGRVHQRVIEYKQRVVVPVVLVLAHLDIHSLMVRCRRHVVEHTEHHAQGAEVERRRAVLVEHRDADGFHERQFLAQLRDIQGGFDRATVPLEEQHAAFLLGHALVQVADDFILASHGVVDHLLQVFAPGRWQVVQGVDMPVAAAEQVEQGVERCQHPGITAVADKILLDGVAVVQAVTQEVINAAAHHQQQKHQATARETVDQQQNAEHPGQGHQLFADSIFAHETRLQSRNILKQYRHHRGL
eukprot:jgi/Antlo1/584/291